jgi:hypothetical protein
MSDSEPLTLASLHAILERILDDKPARVNMPVKILAPKGHLQYGIEGVVVSTLDDNVARLVLTGSEPAPQSTTIEGPDL